MEPSSASGDSSTVQNSTHTAPRPVRMPQRIASWRTTKPPAMRFIKARPARSACSEFWQRGERMIALTTSHLLGSAMKQSVVETVINRDKGCMAPVLDPSGSGTCFGRWTLEHVNHEITRGKRAPDLPEYIVVLCELHAGLKRVAGEQWNTKKENRRRLRLYLFRTYDLLCRFHECELKATETFGGIQYCRPHADLLLEGLFV